MSEWDVFCWIWGIQFVLFIVLVVGTFLTSNSEFKTAQEAISCVALCLVICVAIPVFGAIVTYVAFSGEVWGKKIISERIEVLKQGVHFLPLLALLGLYFV